jgi:hypothetical protein
MVKLQCLSWRLAVQVWQLQPITMAVSRACSRGGGEAAPASRFVCCFLESFR